MQNIIQKIYELDCESTIIHKTKDYVEAAKDLNAEIVRWREKLDESEYDELEHLMNLHTACLSMEIEYSYKKGFKTGINLIFQTL